MHLIVTLVCIGILDCLTGMFQFLNPWLPEGQPPMAWMIFLGVVAACVLVYQAARVAMWTVSQLMRFRSVAEGVALQAWDYAQRLPKGSHLRLWLQNQIVFIGRHRLGLKRVRTANGVVDRVMGVERVRRVVKPAPVTPKRIIVETERDAYTGTNIIPIKKKRAA